MNKSFQEENGERVANATGLATRVASSLVLIGLCCALTPMVVDAADNLLAADCGVNQNAEMRLPSSPASQNGATSVPASVTCGQNSDGIARSWPASETAPCGQPLLRTSLSNAVSADSSKIPVSIAMPTPDRHWCVAKAFNTALESKTVPQRAVAIR